MNFASKPFLKTYMGLLIVSPLVLFFLPADFFDRSAVDMCLSKVLFHRECMGCGMTRAVMHFIHLDFKIAWAYNKLVVLVIPFLIYLWIDLFRTLLKLYRKSN
jgi:hypothetical protein